MMRSTTLFMVAAVCMAVLLSIPAFAAETQTSQVAGKPADAQYPYIAQVVGTNVYVRSGNSQADYPSTKLDAPAKVTVVDEVYGWAKILPPEGTYSWIYKAYVKVDPANPTVGILTGDNVRVWAGADNIDSGSSSGLQTKLNTGEIVELFANQPDTGDYYRIKPPTGAHLWINVDFLKYVGPAKQDRPIVVPPRPETPRDVTIPSETQPSGQQQRPRFTNVEGIDPNEPAPVAETPIDIQIQPEVVEPETQETKVEEPVSPQAAKENELLQRCYDLSAKIEEELKKPLDQQNYTDIKTQLEAIKQEGGEGKAAIYAQFLIDRIGRYELAKSVTETLENQDQQLEQARQKIEQAHQTQLKQVPEKVQFLYTGTLKPSHVYTSKTGGKRYLLIGDDGKILCYIVAGTPTIEALLPAKVDTTVGINGTTVSTERSLVTLVSVTELKSL